MTRIFICHATEDKDAVARPLAEQLKSHGHEVWFDEFRLTLGDSLRQLIDRGLAECDFGVVVLSPAFFKKHWTREELDGLTAREVSSGRKLILPIWHSVDLHAVAAHSPSLAGKLAVSTSSGMEAVADEIIRAIDTEQKRMGLQTLHLRSPHGAEIQLWAVPNAPGSFGAISADEIRAFLDINKTMFDSFLSRRNNHEPPGNASQITE